jgi:hypothetical protein
MYLALDFLQNKMEGNFIWSAFKTFNNVSDFQNVLPTRQGEFRIKFHRSVALDQGDQGPML